MWEFLYQDEKLVAIPKRLIPELSAGDFVAIVQRTPGLPYQVLDAHKD